MPNFMVADEGSILVRTSNYLFEIANVTNLTLAMNLQ